MSRWDPIQNLDSIDILEARKDGGVDLLIIASTCLDGSHEHQKLLLDKIEGYLSYIQSAEFKREFADPAPEKITIVLRYADHPPPVMFALFERCQVWVEKGGARFRAEPLAGGDGPP